MLVVLHGETPPGVRIHALCPDGVDTEMLEAMNPAGAGHALLHSGRGLLTPEEVRAAIDEPVSAMVESVLACLSQAPPELAQDLILQGIHLVGGGGLLRGLDERISGEAEVPVHLVDAPLEAVVLGAGRCIESYESVKAMFMDSRKR